MYFLGYNWSIAVWVGLIALAGLDAETGVVMLLYLDLAYDRCEGPRPQWPTTATWLRQSTTARCSGSGPR